MEVTFDEAYKIAKEKYPHKINYYEEYANYWVFFDSDCPEHTGGDYSPIVIRKSDAEALNYAPIFLNCNAEAEDVGDIISEGKL